MPEQPSLTLCTVTDSMVYSMMSVEHTYWPNHPLTMTFFSWCKMAINMSCVARKCMASWQINKWHTEQVQDLMDRKTGECGAECNPSDEDVLLLELHLVVVVDCYCSNLQRILCEMFDLYSTRTLQYHNTKSVHEGFKFAKFFYLLMRNTKLNPSTMDQFCSLPSINVMHDWCVPTTEEVWCNAVHSWILG